MTGSRCDACGRAAPAEALTCPACGAWVGGSGDLAQLITDVAAALGEHYRVEEEVGRGGYAAVFRVRDLRLDRDLAAKALLPDFAALEAVAGRFRQEARTAAALSHPNIVPIFFVGGDGWPCYVMPLIQGETLAARLRREGRLAVSVALSVLHDIAAALDYAHGRDVVHRDVKPDNVVLEFASGRSLLMDFGIAKALTGETSVRTQSGVVIGTPHYVSPEQAAGERAIDARSDVYSLAVVAYELLAGTPPYDGLTAQAVFALHQAADIPPVTDRRPDLRPEVNGVFAAALAKHAHERIAAAGEFVARLQRAIGRPSLRGGDAVVARQEADDMRLFRTIGTSARPAAEALAQANDVSAMLEAVRTAEAAIAASLSDGDVPQLIQTLRALVGHATDARPALRRPVTDALERLGRNLEVVETLAGAWRGGTPERRAAAEGVLAGLLPASSSSLLTVARRARSADLLLLADRTGALDESAGDDLAADSPAVAEAFAVALRESARPARAIEHWLAHLAQHPHAGVRVATADTAAAHGGILAERIGRALLADGEPDPRAAAIRALGASRRRDAVPDLVRMLERAGADDQAAAADALGRLGRDEAVPALLAVLAARRWFRPVRGPAQHAAARALAALGTAAARDALGRLADDPDPEIRALAADA